MSQLPTWAEHPGHDKTAPLTGPGRGPEPAVAEWLTNLQRRSDKPLRILDVGAGRGDLVAWLCSNGFEHSYGVEPNLQYVANSQSYFGGVGLGRDRIQPFLANGKYPYEDGSFDVVHSNQVVEHVEDIDAFCEEISRVTRRGGEGLHIFPAKWEPIEGHMHMPLAHWFPKGRVRRTWIKFALWTGQAAPYFSDLDLDDRTEVFHRFSGDETFYRTGRAFSQALATYGMDSDRRSIVRAKLRHHGFPPILAPAFAAFREAYVTTRKR
ncbi:class I SAM-dependent methyltransferase [Mycolicibacterium iranicum]|uniref:Class I SAM-dependent methyltransferase n=1 Tax=Mycolicibacterium iranicum TaxID=912594 RepID=A0ABT4HGM8_MYCIR|nr:class I SAM-dependent methyltransferase [Mycolicibacterium iranicum]MCZ0728996.1 class I SAM-dependent methyltransferase [Mycolicibacterium iranicum]